MLDFLKTKPKQPVVTEILTKVQACEELIKKKFMKVDLNNRTCSFHTVLWQGSNAKFRNNWSKSVFLYFIYKRPAEMEMLTATMEMKDLETGNLLGKYSEKTGLVLEEGVIF